MRIIIVLLFIVMNVSVSYASVLYKTPAVFSLPPGMKIIKWAERVNGSGEKEFQAAIREYKNGNYNIALDLFEQLITDHQNSDVSSISSLYAGAIYYRLAVEEDNKDEKILMNALKSYQYGLRTCPVKERGRIPEILLEMGNIYLDLNLLAEAKGNFNRIINDFPSTEFAEKGQYMLAFASMKEGNYRDALSGLDMLMFKYKGRMERERVLLTAEILFLLNEFGDSRKYFEEGLRKWPAYVKGDPEILHHYSECQFQNGEIIKAREGFLTLYNLFPEDDVAGTALRRAGETFVITRNYTVAERIFQDVITYFPNSDDAFASMLAVGDMKIQSGRETRSVAGNKAIPPDRFNQDTLKYYKDVETGSNNEVLVDTARFKTARVLEDQGRIHQAFSVYLELIGHHDKSLNNEVSEAVSEVIDRIGVQIRERLDRGDKSGVLKLYHAYYKNNLRHVRNDGLLMDIAQMTEGLHLYKDAHMIYDVIVERDGNRREQALFNAGKLYAQSGNDRRSVELLGRFISEYPKGSRTVEARALAGYGFYNLKEYEKSGNHLYAVIRDAPYRYPDVYLKLASILQNRAQYDDSISVLKDMLSGVRRQADSDAVSRGNIMTGNSYYAMLKFQEALDAYREGLKGMDQKEGTDTVEFMIGDCLLRLGRADEARKVFSRLSAGANKLVKQVSDERMKDIAFTAGDMN